MDSRMKWIGERVLAFLGLENLELFYNILDSNEGELLDKFSNFVNTPLYGRDDTFENRIFYVHRTYYDKLIEVEKEITEWRIVPPVVKSPTPPPSSKKKGKTKGKVKEKTTKETEKKKGKSKDKNKKDSDTTAMESETVLDDDVVDEESIATGEIGAKEIAKKSYDNLQEPPILDPETEGTVEYYTMKRFVPMMIKFPKININFGFSDINNLTDDTKLIYFIRKFEERIPVPVSDFEANCMMPQLFIVGSCHGDFLKSLLNVTKHSYFPLFESIKNIINEVQFASSDKICNKIKTEQKLDNQYEDIYYRPSYYHGVAKIINENSIEARIKLGSTCISKDFFNSNIAFCGKKKEINNLINYKVLYNLTSLTKAVERFNEPNETEIKIQIPNIPELQDEKITLDEITKQADIMRKLESAAKDWCAYITLNIDDNHAGIEGGPLHEYTFWKDYCANITKLVEQLQNPTVKKIVNILQAANSTTYNRYIDKENQVMKSEKSSKETLQLISTSLRYFEVVTNSLDLEIVSANLSGMLHGISILWLLSRYYCNDEKMLGLLENIANCLSKKIETHLAVETMFNKSFPEIFKLANDGKMMMTKWKQCYMTTRKSIEESGKLARWEFDKKRLFHKTDYLSEVCDNLSNVAQVLMDFKNILGHELKCVIENQNEIDDLIKKVHQLILPIKTVDFNIFIVDNKENFDVIMNDFYKEVVALEKKAHIFIDFTFENIRSSEDALKMLLKFVHIKTRPSIHNLIITKFDNIWEKFTNEVAEMNHLFETYEKNPPLLCNHPPISGSIFWFHSIYTKINKTWNKFQKVNELEDSLKKTLALNQLDAFNSSIQNTCTKYYNEWLKKSQLIVKAILEDYLLCTTSKSENKRIESLSILHSKKKSLETSKSVKRNFAKHFKSEIAIKKMQENHSLLGDTNLCYCVNFKQKLFELIEEILMMERLGFNLPINIRNFAMQKKRFHREYEALYAMVQNYSEILSRLKPFEVKILRKKLHKVEMEIYPGLKRISWSSLCVMKYIDDCNKEINILKSICWQVSMLNEEVQNILDELSTFNLFPISIPENEKDLRYPCEIFFTKMEELRSVEINKMKNDYEKIGLILKKLEYLISGTASGESQIMFDVYHYWKTKILSTFKQICFNNLQNFNHILKADNSIFQVDAFLQASNVSIRPTLREINDIVLNNLNDFQNSFQFFLNWILGTCQLHMMEVDTESIKQNSLYNDIVKDSNVIEAISALLITTNLIASNSQDYVMKWSKFKSLWSYDKQSSCEKYIQNHTQIMKFDERLSFFENVIFDLDEHKKVLGVGSIQVNLQPIITQIQNHAMEWKTILGECLIISTKEKMTALFDVIQRLRRNLNRNIKCLKDFKLVMLTITEIKKITISSEVMCDSIHEIFLMLKSHNIHLRLEDIDSSILLKNDWHNLHMSSLFRHDKLDVIKEIFAKMTSKRVEEFVSKVRSSIEKFEEEGPGNIEEDFDQGLILMAKYKLIFDDIESQRVVLCNAEQLFDIPLTDYSELKSAKNNFDQLNQIFASYKYMKEAMEKLSNMLWIEFDPKLLNEEVEKFRNDFTNIPKNVRNVPSGKALSKKIMQIKSVIPVIESLKNDAIKATHWKDLMNKIGKEFDISKDKFTLGNVFSLQLHEHMDTVQEIIICAIKESGIEKDIKEIDTIWIEMKFEVLDHFKGGENRCCILNSCDDIINQLEEHRMNLQRMSTSKYIGAFATKVKEWDHKLHKANEIIEQWLFTQQKWLYLENIFVGTEIRSQLPNETEKFDELDKMYIQLMKTVAKNPKVIENCLVPNRKDVLIKISTSLDECQKSLVNYIDSKRNLFPRFFFLSIEELLSILGTTEPTSIQEHINKIFENMSQLNMIQEKDGAWLATGLISNENEILEFQNELSLSGRIECWMNTVVKEMKQTNKQLTKKCIYEFGKAGHRDRVKWIACNKGMISIVSNLVWWTVETEDAFLKINKGDQNAMKTFLKKLNNDLDTLVSGIKNDLSANDYKKIKTMIIIDVHSRDIIEKFVMKNVLDNQDFAWESQLRFYWLKQIDDLCIEQCSGIFDYGYEYMGLNGRLIITPLSERIYMTITQALTMHLGAAPSGPAGTGKTETTKDLAKALGILCMVTNCGESMTFQAVGQILSGLSMCGAWGCFDEFNRIDLSMLSVISTVFQSIRTACITKSGFYDFSGTRVKVEKNLGFFITMNPGYAGRTELPETIKALFRPVMCIVPDTEIICQVSLYSDGFLLAKTLAKKIAILYKLAQDQLSKQFHYDWGLRALIALLRMSSKIKREGTFNSEEEILIKALRDINHPKFINEDVPLYLNLLKDLFPGLEYPRNSNVQLSEAVTSILQSKQYEVIPNQIEKMIELSNTMTTQHSVMLVGPTGGGKSTILDILVKGENRLGISSQLITINPKSIPVSELYGVLDTITREWTDGLLSSIFRKINKPSTGNERHYLLFDGDVDALWIEDMNSVMDDNKLLTLANGERIRLFPHCSLLFEVGDLMYASPATVSRAGMIYVDPENLGFVPYWKTWLKTRSSDENEKKILNSQFELFIPGTVKYIFTGFFENQQKSPLKLIIEQSPLNMVIQLCNVIDTLTTKDEGEIYDETTLRCIFIISIYYSLGATIEEEDRLNFDEYVKQCSNMLYVDDTPNKKATTEFLPRTHLTLYDYYLNIKNKCWEAWEWLVPSYVHNRDMSFSDILVPTADTIQTMWLIKLLEKTSRPLLITGDIGTSKTAVILSYIKNLDPELYVLLKLNFSYCTSSLDVQTNLESNLEKRKKNIFGPPITKKLLVFIDDMNMPQVDQYGTQQPIAFLKLLLERSGFYSREKDLQWKKLVDVNFISAMGKTGGGRSKVDSRFLSKFMAYNLTFPSEKTMQYIYSSILNGHFSLFTQNVIEIIPKVVEMTIEIFKIIVTELPPTPSKFHYIFNLRDLSRITSGLCLCEPVLFPESKCLLRVWRNEFCRVVYDRLNNIEDQMLFRDFMSNTIKKYFGEESEREIAIEEAEYEQAVKSTTSHVGSDSDVITDTGIETTDEDITDEDIINEKQKELTIEEYVLRDPLLFGDYRNALNNEQRLYEDLLDYDAVYYLFQEILEDYNENIEKMSLVLFEDYLENLTRIHRVLRMEKNHMLLIGDANTGKHTMVKLATFAADADFYEITTAHGYNENSFKDDLKQLYTKLASNKRHIVFIIKSNQIVNETFLDLLNNMLISGLIPTLFNDEEKDAIISIITEDAANKEYTQTSVSTWEYFCKKCSSFLHIIYVTHPGDLLRVRCTRFPGLVNNTTINWIYPWPKQALLAVANIFLSDVERLPEQYKQSIIQQILYVHESVNNYTIEYKTQLKRLNYVAPRHYIKFINSFLDFVEIKDKYILEQCKRLEGGIGKIEEANIEIVKLNSELEIQKVTLTEQNEKCSSLMKKIEAGKLNANERMKEASEKNIEMLKNSEIIKVNKEEAEKTLELAEPALKAARTALEKLDKADITEIRTFQTPPPAVQIVCECILILRGYKEINWKTAQKMMYDANFVRTLLDMEYENVTTSQIKQIKTHMKDMKRAEDMEKISKAGYGMLKFVSAVIDYCAVLKEVKPKKDKVLMLEKESMNTQKQLDNLNQQIQKINDELEELNNRYTEMMKVEEELKLATEKMTNRLNAADKLINGLSSEKKRWQEELKALNLERTKIFGGCLLSAAFLIYLGPFTYEYRERMLYVDWLNDLQQRNIPIILPFKVDAYLSSDVEISGWISEELPSDEFSIQNGILTVHSTQFPLCIDPQSQALNWIKNREAKNNLKILALSENDYIKQIELAISYGQPVLIQNFIDEIPILNNLLEKNIKTQLGRKFITLGNNEVEYDDNFRLYLTTKLTNPYFSPSLYTKLAIINYLVTMPCLEEQLLKIVVCNESPELEKQQKELVFNTFENKKLLRDLEDFLLHKLTTTTGNILDNEELVNTLENTKSKAKEISEKLKLAEITSSEINSLCSKFKPVAIRGAVLFFTLLDMANVNNMYQYSLISYWDTFQLSINKPTQAENNDEKLSKIIDRLTDDIYEYGCIGIFEKDKLLFSFLITINIAKNESHISQNQIDFFIKGSVSVNKYENIPSWLLMKNWEDICYLTSVFPNTFRNLKSDLINSESIWEKWSNVEEPESEDFPCGYSDKITEFEKLMLLRCFRVDRTYCAITKYIKAIMGEKYVSPPITTLKNVYEQTSEYTTVIFIVSAGSDPMGDLIKLAEEKQINESYIKHSSLGFGQESVTLSLLEEALSNGYWIVIQNCHLLPKFLCTLEEILENLTDPQVNFRVWLTTEPTSNFPIGMLQRGIKVVNEPPSGLKPNLQSSYSKISEEDLENCSHSMFKKITYVLAFFHAVILERRKYNKIGWNCTYNFNDSDYRISLDILQHYLNKSQQTKKQIAWDTIKYLIGEIIYGGHVIDSYDRRILNTYVNEYFGGFIIDEFQPFYFYHDDNIKFTIPLDSTKQQYIDFINDNIPLYNSPEVYGLHINAEINYYNHYAQMLWNYLIEMQTDKGATTESVSKEEITLNMAQEIQKKIPKVFDIVKTKKQFEMNMIPSCIVLLQELERYNLLVSMMKTTIETLISTLLGEIGMDITAEDLLNSLFNGRLPKEWSKLTPQTCKSLAGWMDQFMKRNEQYEYWATKEEPFVMWLSGLHVPKSYLIAHIQMACRKHTWSLDNCGQVTHVTNYINPKDVEERPKDGCYINGLYLEGAAWDTEQNCLKKCQPKILSTELPIMHIIPTELKNIKLQNTLLTPVYTTSLRRNQMGIGLVFESNLRTTQDNSHWILQGVCLIMNED